MLKFTPTPEYLALDQHSREIQEENDCAVRATCVVTGATYDDVHALYDLHGRRRRSGAYIHTTRAVLADLGFTMREWSSKEKIALLQSYPDYWVKSITLRQTMLFPEQWAPFGPLLLNSHRHLSAFRDGKLHDHMCRLKSRVHAIYDVNPK